MRKSLLLLVACTLPVAVHAARATESFAPDQIRLAEDSLREARAAAAAADYGRAADLVRGVRLDARLAWGMTDDRRLRSEAASVAEQADDLARTLGPAVK